jgi:hypothetical protein
MTFALLSESADTDAKNALRLSRWPATTGTDHVWPPSEDLVANTSAWLLLRLHPRSIAKEINAHFGGSSFVPVTREFSLPSSGRMCVKSYLDEHCGVQSGLGLLTASIPYILNFEKM